ncbi:MULTISPECIES: hypothetical protein [Wolbachia]|uniref:Uncharacterized protein n=1 Tax=Wolbachia pipientis TaxID=955 RepID=A0A7G5CDA1_WOLPI|nr:MULTISPECIES: hypothetical protein [Wolbachia]MDE5061117.1 hypothetical protein [Wolbachia endosymbiont of Drosophila nikananu]MDE5062651.1 hypothetical protein [Wolbachia endosymbiont of Drosophila tsacasi]QMV47185.1 hypothetical protein HC356_04025 [Wolbachia pipientis]
MKKDKTERGYLLPHPDNIAVQDVVRIRKTIEQIDVDISSRNTEHTELKSAFERFSFETFLNLWGKNR